MKPTIKHGTIEAFFQRGKEVARAADQGAPIPVQQWISVEDPQLVAHLESLDPAELTELILSGALDSVGPPDEPRTSRHTSFRPQRPVVEFDVKAWLENKDSEGG